MNKIEDQYLKFKEYSGRPNVCSTYTTQSDGISNPFTPTNKSNYTMLNIPRKIHGANKRKMETPPTPEPDIESSSPVGIPTATIEQPARDLEFESWINQARHSKVVHNVTPVQRAWEIPATQIKSNSIFSRQK